MEPVVRLQGVSKRFGATRALVDVDLDLAPGSVHGLVGQNGAGKTTLGKVLSGIHERDSGDFVAFGHAVRHWSPRAALEHGIAMIQQELSLVPELTVARNVYLGLEERRLGILSEREAGRFKALDAQVGFRLDPAARVRSLRFADRQKVEILRALARDAQLIVMDEPTSALTVNETEHLHQIIGRLAAEGRTVVYISHYLRHVLRVCGTVTTMRDGRIVRTGPAEQETEASLVKAMVGRSLDIEFPPRRPADVGSARPLLRVERLSSPPTVVDVSFEVHAGEIIGLAGLVGSGRSETLRAVFGADRSSGGTVEIDSRPYAARTPQESIRRGMAMLPEDRRGQGLVATMSVRENMSLPSVGRYTHWGLVDRGRETAAVVRLLHELAVVPQRPDEDIQTLSGGNQQKVLLARWLGVEPRLLLLDEPTRGIDVGAKQQIYQTIVELAARGFGIVLVSSELEEVMGLAHRVYLVRNGQTLGAVDPQETTLDQVLFRLFGVTADRPA